MHIAQPSRRALLAAAAVAVAAAVGGLALTANGSPEPSATAPTQSATPTPSASDLPTGSQPPTVPPGDPGAGPSVPEGSAAEEPPSAKMAVPRRALLDAETVAAVVGGSWQSVQAPPDSCDFPRPRQSSAARSGGLSGSLGQLVETVAIHADGDAAVQAVKAMAKRLRGCGWTLEEEPPLGVDSAQLTRRSPNGVEQLVVVAAEGLTVTVLGRGAVTANQDDWAAIVDVAIGTSCVAAPDGCH